MPQLFKDHFSGVSDTYAQFRPRYPDALFSFLASLTPRCESAWDCATGSGQAALPLVRFFRRVFASDASMRQVCMAMRRPGLHYFVAAAEAICLGPASIDLVTVAQAMHWFDSHRFYAEVDRVLCPGGVLAVWSYGRLEVTPDAIQDLLDDFYNHTVGAYWPPERCWVEEGYASLDFPYDALQAPNFTLTAEWTLNHLAGYLRTWSATQRFVKARGNDPVVDLIPKMALHWGDPQARRVMRWPIALRVGAKPPANGDGR